MQERQQKSANFSRRICRILLAKGLGKDHEGDVRHFVAVNAKVSELA